jgi:hypothetical protein
MYINFVKNNMTLVAIVLFIVCFSILISFKPAFLFNKDGSIKSFGLGYKKKTVIPVWVIAIVFAIISYYLVLYYISLPKFKDF